jgi:Plasmid encoded RepA protein
MSNDSLTPVQRRLIAAAHAIGDAQPDDPLFLHSCLCQTYFPTRQQPPELRRWERAQGYAHLSVEAGRAWHPAEGRFIDLPLPYGPKARLILMHLNSEAVRHRSHVIEIEGSMTAFVERVQGRHSNSRDIAMFKAQLAALAAARITMALDRPDKPVQVQTQIVGAFDLWFTKNASQRVLWPGTVALSLDYYETLCRHAVPLDERAVAALAKSTTALDIYCWLAQRLHRIAPGAPHFVPWAALYEQFGEGYSQIRQFRAFFLRQLRQVNAAYPAARFDTGTGGMRLWHSPPPMLKRLVTVHAIGDATRHDV